MDKVYHSGECDPPCPELSSLWTFGWLPSLLIGIGCGTFVLAAAGLLFSAMETRPPLIAYAITLSMLVLFQCFFIYCTFQASSLVSQQLFLKEQNVIGETEKLYKADETYRENWNAIQSDLRCCGFSDWMDYNELGLTNDELTALGIAYCYPKSCCTDQINFGCWSKQTSCYKVYNNYWPKDGEIDGSMSLNLRGCNKVLHQMYKEELPPIFLFIELLGAINILVEVAAIALASAYVAQITRRAKRYNMDNMEMR